MRDEQEHEAMQFIETHGPRYRSLVAKFEDPEEMRRIFTEALPNAVQGLMGYNAKTDPALAAVAEISKAQLRLGQLLDDVEFMETYEEKREILSNLQRFADATSPEGGADQADLPQAG